jgi:hypothetical protein
MAPVVVELMTTTARDLQLADDTVPLLTMHACRSWETTTSVTAGP